MIQPRIQRITSKGQITLPIAWRRRMKTDIIMVREAGNAIEIRPAETVSITGIERDDGVIIFDANRDTDGKPVPVEKFISILKKLEREDTLTRARSKK